MDVAKLLLFPLLLCVWEVETAEIYCPEAAPNYVSGKWDFSRLRDFPNFRDITIRSNLPRLDWNWFTDKVKKVRVSSDNDVIFGTDGCEVRSGITIDTVQLILRTLPLFPTCWPPKTRLISITQKHLTSRTTLNASAGEHFLPKFNQGDDSCYDWPDTTTIVRLKGFEFNQITPSMFCDPFPKFYSIYLGSCENGLHSLTNLPRTLEKMYLYDCKLEDQNLNLTDNISHLYVVRAGIDRLPVGLPVNLEILSFDGNNITKIDDELEHLTRLKTLDLDNNQLKVWPGSGKLPSTLEVIEMKHNLLKYIPSNAFDKLENLTLLALDDNRLLNYPINFHTTIIKVDLRNNEIRTITGNYRYCNQCTVVLIGNPLVCNKDLFEYISWMSQYAKKLDIDGWCRPFLASVTSAEQREEVFHFINYYSEELGCEYNINSLKCQHKNLTSVPLPSPFSFQRIDLGYNQISVFPDSIYLNQTYLTKIALDNNLLREIPYGLPSELLTHLWLRRNKITHVTRRNGDELAQMNNLEVLDLGENLIKTIDAYDVRGLSHIQLLRLDNNPFDCQCKLFFFVRWWEEHYARSFNPPMCETPEFYKYHYLPSVVINFSYSCLGNGCYYDPPSNVNCSYNHRAWTPYNKMAVVDMLGGPFSTPIVNGTLTITNSNWTNPDLAKLTNLQFFNIDLSGNLLTRFPSKIFGEFTEIVDVSDNMITHLPPANDFVTFTRLQVINFTNNRITIIQPEAIPTLQVVPFVSMKGNPLSCECEQRPLMTWLESIQDRLRDDNVEMGYGSGIYDMTCVVPEMLEGRKMLDEANENFDQYCPIPSVNRSKLIIAITIPALLIAVLASILLNIYLDKKRKKRESQNIILGFKQLLSKESEIDDVTTNYKYDAFVSYANQEEDFVYSLIKELEEKRSRKISFHQRDFIAGLSIVDNIVECIGNSSRVILIISDDFIRSSWCQYEIQVALANMHKRRRGKLLVPILVQGNKSEDKMRGNTRTILSEIAAITAPSHRDDVTMWKNFCDEVDRSLPGHANYIVV